HGLVASSIRRESEPLRLSPERRRKVLEVIGAQPVVSAPHVTAIPKKRSRWRMDALLSAAAALAIVTAIAGVILAGAGYTQKKAARSKDDSGIGDPFSRADLADTAAEESSKTQNFLALQADSKPTGSRQPEKDLDLFKEKEALGQDLSTDGSKLVSSAPMLA